MSIIDERGDRYVRMANLSCVGSHAINGVAELHTQLLKRDVLGDFYALWPERFFNRTNGVTPRRWMLLANPRLASLLTETLGEDWPCDLGKLRDLEPLASDPGFLERWSEIKRANKLDFAAHVSRAAGTAIDPQSLYDVQVKRIHEYKRQHLSVLHIIALYLRIKSGQADDAPSRTFIFGGKAAPGYHFAKLMIKLINSVGGLINRDPQVDGRLKVVFLPNYNVKNGQRVYPAADLSEQISTAGKEASGTGNMKFALNGALTIGTLDGANIELREEVGAENFFLFGLAADEVRALTHGGYRPMDYYENDAELRAVIDLLRSGFFSRGDASLFEPLVDSLLRYDPYLLLADFRSYIDCQQRVAECYQDTPRWARMSIMNTARSGKFSSDRTIREYAQDIWRVQAVPIRLLSQQDVTADLDGAFGARAPSAQ
jgi:glycogen phosphorylase